jgi:hypothetical protein
MFLQESAGATAIQRAWSMMCGSTARAADRETAVQMPAQFSVEHREVVPTVEGHDR